MFGLSKRKQQSTEPTGLIELGSFSTPTSKGRNVGAMLDFSTFEPGTQKTYDRTAGLMTADLVYKPVDVVRKAVAGGLGPSVSYSKNEYNKYQEFLQSGIFTQEDFYAPDLTDPEKPEVFLCTLIGTPGGIERLKTPILMMYNTGVWFEVERHSKEIIAQVFTDCMGCGEIGIPKMWVSPEYGDTELIDTIYHESLHNAGHGGDVHPWIYEQAARIAAYSSRYGQLH